MKRLTVLTLTIFLIFISSIARSEDQREDVEPFSQAELEQILAPIALYPDTVLSHILIAATYPLEVIQAERWTTKNSEVTGSDAVQAVEKKDWDPSIKALVAFPQVLNRLSENLEWTQKLGDAFLQDEEKLLASVQSLRQRAYEAGNLDEMENVSVIQEDTSIVIEPIEQEVVYVPYYDTRVVYGPWYWSHYPPVYWDYPSYGSPYYAGYNSPFYWGPSVNVSFGFFFSSFNWGNHYVARIPYDYYRPHQYYNRHQIINHQNVGRWAHNPSHRRGVSYRSVTVSNRYNSNRASQAEVHRYRNGSDYRNRSGKERASERRISNRDERKQYKRNPRIASPARIKQELKDGRISIKERNTRYGNQSEQKFTTKYRQQNQKSKTSRTRTKGKMSQRDVMPSNPSKQKASNSHSGGSKQQGNHGEPTAKQQNKNRSKNNDNASHSFSKSSSHSKSSSRSNSKGRSSNHRSSGSNRSSHSKGQRKGH